MNASILSRGLIVHNYKEMCKMLKEPIKGGSSKRSQLKKWQRHFSYERQGNKFIITEVFDIPKPKSVNSIFTKHIELLLMYELATRENCECTCTKTDLFHLLGMVNSNFLKENRHETKESLSQIPFWEINHFYIRSSKKLSEILFSALNSLKRRDLLDYSIYWIVCDSAGSHIASIQEVAMIQEVEKAVLDEMGLSKMPFYQTGIYHKKVNLRLNRLYEWKRVYREVNIRYNHQYSPDMLLADKSEIVAAVKNNKRELNDKVVAAINKQAGYYYDKNCEEYEKAYRSLVDDGWATDSKINFESRVDLSGVYNFPSEYLENQMFLTNLLIYTQPNENQANLTH